MAIRFIRIGSSLNIAGYDDANYDSAIETTAPIKAGNPIDPNDAVTLESLNTSLSGYFLLAGRAGGQIGYGGTGSGDDLEFHSTSNVTKGSIVLHDLVELDHLQEHTTNHHIVFNSPVVLPAGTAAVGTGPIKFVDGTLVTTPEEGLIELNSKRWYITGADRRIISRGSNTIISSTTVANTIDETTLWTASLPANITGIGKLYRVTGMGQFSTHDAADTITLRIKIGTTTIISFASTAGVVSNKGWHVDAWITVRTLGATGTVSAHGQIMLNYTTSHLNTTSTVIDTTTAENITITAQWDSADVANTIQIDQAILEVLD